MKAKRSARKESSRTKSKRMNNSVRRQADGQAAVDSDFMRSDTQPMSSEMIDADVSAGASYYNDEIK